MKKLILILAVCSLLGSCKNKAKQDAAIQRAKQATIDSIAYANNQQRIIDSLEELTRNATTAVEEEKPAMTPIGSARKANSTKKRPSTRTAPVVEEGAASSSTSATKKTTPVPEKKKGLNNAAKGAIIGLGTGAAAGAIIGKENRGKGAVVGGIIGAIGGAVGGAVIDKRKAKKAAERDSLRKDSIK